MNLFDLNNDNIIMNIDGKDIEMKAPICYGKEYDKWLVSKRGKVWSLSKNRILPGNKKWAKRGEDGERRLMGLSHIMYFREEDWWGDGSSRQDVTKKCDGSLKNSDRYLRDISAHKMVIDTWAPLYDNPPEGIIWEEWEIVRDLPSVYNLISKSVVIDHIDDDPTNNHLDNLRRVSQWDNQASRKAKGI